MTGRSLTALIMAAALLAGSGNSLSCSQCDVQKLESLVCHAPNAAESAALVCSCCITDATEDFSSAVGVLTAPNQTNPDARLALSRATVSNPINLRVATSFGPADGDIPGPPLYLIKRSYLI